MQSAVELSVGSTASRSDAGGTQDHLVHQFVAQLLPPDEASKVLRGHYTSALHSALLDRLARLREDAEVTARCRLNPLQKWRLRRVEEFVRANLEERITLQALAAEAGVSRMYFAAQFRRATGMRPHDYVVQLRIAAAREMLADPQRPIVDIALSVGFQTQSHFTTVFKAIVGTTPNRFRQTTSQANWH
jgi:AraC-like DNA-binding protein